MPELNDLSNLQFPPGTSDAARSVPAERILDWLRLNRQPLRLGGARITGPADFGGVTFAHEVVIQGCFFEQPLDLGESRFGKSLDLRGCTFAAGLDLGSARVAGSLLLSRAHVLASSHPPLVADCSLMRIEGNFLAEGLASQVRLSCSGIRVAGNIDLGRAEIVGGLDLEVAHVEGSLHAGHLTVLNSTGEDGDVLLGGSRVAGQVSFSGARIARDLNLYSATIACGLRCASSGQRRTVIGRDVLIGGTKISFGADFSGARIAGDFNLEDAFIEGELTALTTEAPPPTEEEKPRVEVRNLDGFVRTEVHGAARLGGLTVTGAARLNSIFVRHNIDLSTAELRGGLYCVEFRGLGAEVGGPVQLNAARISVTADFSEARITGGLYLQNAHVDGDLFCHRTQVVHDPAERELSGHFAFAGVKVTGQLNINGARVAGDINLQSAEVTGGVYGRPLRRRKKEHGDGLEAPCLHVGQGVFLAAAKIAGGVHLHGVQVGRGLSLDSAQIDGGLYLSVWDVPDPRVEGKAGEDEVFVPCGVRILGGVSLDAARVSGEVLCGGLTVGGDFSLKSAELRNGLNFKPAEGHRSTVHGSIRLGAAKVSGEVNFGGCRVGGDLDLEGAVVDGKLIVHAETHRTEIAGRASLDGVKVSGPVNLNGADVQSDLDLRGAQVQGELSCAHAAVAGSLSLDQARVAGQVELAGSTIGKELSLQGAIVEGALTCRRTHVGERVDLGSCVVRLAELEFTGLEDPAAARRGRRTWPAFRLENFQFQELRLGLEGREKARDYLDLLKAAETFDVSTYVAMERWLRNQGKDEQANKVYLAMRAGSRRWGKMNPVSYLIDLLFEPAVRVAMRYREMVFAFAVSMVVATLLFLDPSSVRPKGAAPGAVAVESPTAGSGPRVLDPDTDWNLYEALGMAVQLHIPMANFPIAQKWEVTREPVRLAGVNLFIHYDWYASFISLLGYIAVPLFLGGLFNSWLRSKTRGD